MKEFVIEVFKAGKVGTDTEHVVQVTMKVLGKVVDKVQLPGGDFKNAKGMAEGLKAMADSGIDLMQLIP